MRVAVAAVCLLAGLADAEPRMRPLLPMPGVAIGGHARAVAFCETTQRAAVLLHSGDVVTVDADGTVTQVGRSGLGSAIVCDRNNRISVVTSRALVTFDGARTHTTPMPAVLIRHVREVDDGAIALVDVNGTVYRYDGTAVTTWWKVKHATTLSAGELDARGERLLVQTGNKIAIHDRNGLTIGPSAVRATWHGDDAVLLLDPVGNRVARWTIGKPYDELDEVHALADRLLFTRTTLQAVGSRLLVQVGDKPMLVLELAANGKPIAKSPISRLPTAVRIAGGAAPFAAVMFQDRARVIDLRVPSFVIPPGRPTSAPMALAFSPDGRKLAMLGGDRDVLVVAIDQPARVQRLVPPGTGFLRGPLRWHADGTLVGAIGRDLIRWTLDGDAERSRGEVAVGTTPAGDPIVFTRDRRLAIERRHGAQRLPRMKSDASPIEAHASERFLAVRAERRFEVYALDVPADAASVFRTRDRSFLRGGTLVGDGPSVMFLDEHGSLFLATPTSETLVAKYEGAPLVVASPDRRRVAVGTRRTLHVYDERGRELWHVATGGRIVAMAWSPDLRTLAVSTDGGIELWTIPR